MGTEVTTAVLKHELDKLKAEKRQLERDVEHLRRHDVLTGLLTRQAFLATIHDRICTNRPEKPTGVMIEIGFRGLPQITGTLRRHVSDYVLSAVAARLNLLQGEGYYLGRIDYWNFGVFIPDTTDPLDALSRAKKYVDLLSEPIDWIDSKIKFEVSAGVALCTEDVPDGTTLLERAGLALKSASEKGGPNYAFFNPILALEAKRREDVHKLLLEGVDKDWFRLQYQPVFDIEDGKLAGFEALLRMHHPERGVIPPADFIPIAEETGLITKLGAWALTEACKVAVNWPEHITVSVNISPEQFYTGTLLTDVHNALAVSSFPPYRLELEVTESTLLKDSEVVLQQLNSLRELGCSIALDDFGTGYSSLSYLWKFPFSKLKVDRSFVQAADTNPTVRSMLKSIIDLSRNLGLKTTAEGIETPSQAAIVRQFGADFVQGYLTGRPAHATDVAAIILKDFTEHLAAEQVAAEPIRQAAKA
jgi:predicted signal transduction protein with EAL and GGDEF domain